MPGQGFCTRASKKRLGQAGARLTQGAGASRHGVRGLDTKRIHAGGLFVAWFLVALHQA